MKLFSLVSILALSGAVAAGALLFWTSQRVQDLEGRLSRVRAASAAEAQAIRVLRAEWDYLNSPDRIEALAAAYLDLKAPALIAPEGGMPPLSGDLAFFENDGGAVPAARPVAVSAAKAPPVPAQRPAGVLKEESESFGALLESLHMAEGEDEAQ